jgi:hypothetical protein
MDLTIDFFFNDAKNAFVLDAYKDNITINDEVINLQISINEIESFTEELMVNIEKYKIEVLMSIQKYSKQANTWQLDLMSTIIENKIFMIHRFTEITLGREICNFDFIDKKYKRKAKLNQIMNPNLNLNPEVLWKNSWLTLSKYQSIVHN